MVVLVLDLHDKTIPEERVLFRELDQCVCPANTVAATTVRNIDIDLRSAPFGLIIERFLECCNGECDTPGMSW
ncbi:hypothetical protein D8Y22_02145 [Salinadaptatus halalkaliphilus]|uniref:Uncharacterized protein n=1 Tax=Salinadaptatus halalkaliphilus TaxID=2419781 RepID=A0A4S3TUX6_9EURY|nr:hypothetical protein D8Y22_02145 [Salinadaptatus halalkaliphilus]